MKLSAYVCTLGTSYKTAYCQWKIKMLDIYQIPTKTNIVCDVVNAYL